MYFIARVNIQKPKYFHQKYMKKWQKRFQNNIIFQLHFSIWKMRISRPLVTLGLPYNDEELCGRELIFFKKRIE